MQQSRIGSTRIMTPVEPGLIALRYTDRWSAFDRGSSPQEIPGIGAARCACAVHSFTLAHLAGLPTHFIKQVDPITIHVQEFAVPEQPSLSGTVHGRVLPLEWIWRDRVYGSLYERLKSGKTNPEDLGFPQDCLPNLGAKLPKVLLECTTKFEPVDRHLSIQEARKIACLSETQWDAAWKLVSTAVDVSAGEYEAAGYMTPDGKLELGMKHDGSLMLVDVFGTQDENRIVRDGTLYCKDIIRNYLASLRWKTELDEAKKAHPSAKSLWPSYPELPPELVEQVSAAYAQVARDYVGYTR